MADPALIIRIAANVDELKKNLAEGQVQVEALSASMERMSTSLQGDKLIQTANNMTAAVENIGGTSRLTESEMARVNATLDKAIQKYDALGKEAPPAMLELFEATKKTEEASTDWGGVLTGVVAGAVAAVTTFVLDATAALIRMAVDGIGALITRGSEITALTTSFEALAVGVNQSADAMAGELRAASSEMIADVDLMAAANKALLLGLPVTVESLGTMAEAATVLGRAMGQDATKSLDDLTTALGRSSPMILDNLGLTVKVGEANEAYAAKLGTTTEQLTEAEKKTAFYEAAMAAAAVKVEQLGGVQLTLGDRVQQSAVQLQNWIDALAIAVATSPAFNAALDVMNQALTDLLQWLSDNQAGILAFVEEGVTIAISAFEGLQEIGSAVITLFAASLDAWNAVSTAFTSLTSVVGEFKKSIDATQFGLGDLATFLKNSLILELELMTLALQAIAGALAFVTGNWDEWKASLESTNLGDINLELELSAEGMKTLVGIMSSVAEAGKRSSDEMKKFQAEVKKVTDTLTGQGAIDAALVYAAAVEQIGGTAALTQKQQIEVNAVMRDALVAFQALGRDAPQAMRDIFDATSAAAEPLKKVSDLIMQMSPDAFTMTADEIKVSLGGVNTALIASIENLRQQEIWFASTSNTLQNQYLAQLIPTAIALGGVGDAVDTVSWSLRDQEALWTRNADAMRDAFLAELLGMEDSLWDFSKVLESVFQSVPRLIEAALTGGADLAKAAEAIAVEFASVFMATLGSAISGGNQLVASAFGAIGASAAVLFSALFGGLIETDFEKVGTELAERFGQSFSEELQRQVEQSFKEVGDRGAAVLANLSDIVAELGGVTAENFALIVSQADELVLQFARRTLDVETVTRELAAVYPQLAAEFENAGAAGQQAFVDLTTRALTFGTIDLPTVIQAIEDIGQSFVDLDAAGQQAFLDLILAAQAFGATTEDLIKAVADPFASVLGPALAMVAENSDLASQELLNVIAVAQQLGVATAEIAKFLEQMQALGLTGLEGLLTNIFPGEDVQALADVFLDTFQALLDAGLSFDEALKALGPGLDNLIVKMQEAGLEGTEAFQRITDLANQAGNEIINTAVAAAQAAVDVLVSLNNQALLDQKTFSALAQTIVQAFEALQNEGVAGEDALRRLQPELQKLWELQQDFNFIVDDGTQALLDQAVAAGFVGDQFRSESSQMLQAMQGVFLILIAIAEALGATIPDSLTTMANEMRFAASGGKEEMEILVGSIEDVATTAEQVGDTVHQELSQAAKDSAEAMAKAMDEISREAEKTGKSIENEIANGANAAAAAMSDAAEAMIQDLQAVQRQAEETGGASPTGVELITVRIHEAVEAMGQAATQMVADLRLVGAAAEGMGLPMLATSFGATSLSDASLFTQGLTTHVQQNVSTVHSMGHSASAEMLQPVILQLEGHEVARTVIRLAPRLFSTIGV